MKLGWFFKGLFLGVLITPVWGQVQTSGETEFGSDGKSGTFFSQYLFLDAKQWNLVGRYFWVNNALNRVEFAAGPTIKFGRNHGLLKFDFGGTSDQEVMLAGTLVIKVFGRDIVYIGDGKVATQPDALSQYYQRFFLPIDKKAVWQFRTEHLFVGGAQAFFRIGGEYQWQFNPHAHIYIAPFYDPIVRSPGGQVGFRCF